MKLNLKLWHVIVAVVVLSGPSVWAANTMWSALSALTGANVATGDKFPLLDVSDTTHGAGGTAKTITASELKNNFIYAAGSATAGSWPVFGSGTVLTTAEDGAIEQDADAFYLTTDAGNRGVVPVKHCIRADSTRTFTSNTSQQAIFNSPTNGRLTLETGTYLFDGVIAMTSMSTTSGNGKFSLNNGGTATLGSILWHVIGKDVAAETTGGASGGGWHVIATQTATDIVTAGTAASVAFALNGTFEVTGAGTIVPSFAQTTAAAAIVSVGSYLCFNRIGSTSVVSIGQWD
jgi:hypothetical protein